MAPKLVAFVLEKELLNFSKMAPNNCTISSIHDYNITKVSHVSKVYALA